MEELWKLFKNYWEITVGIFGLGVLWTNLQRDRKYFMERQQELDRDMQVIREECTKHKASCPAALHGDIKAISSLMSKTASDVAYIRGQIDGITKRNTRLDSEG